MTEESGVVTTVVLFEVTEGNDCVTSGGKLDVMGGGNDEDVTKAFLGVADLVTSVVTRAFLGVTDEESLTVTGGVLGVTEGVMITEEEVIL